MSDPVDVSPTELYAVEVLHNGRKWVLCETVHNTPAVYFARSEASRAIRNLEIPAHHEDVRVRRYVRRRKQ